VAGIRRKQPEQEFHKTVARFLDAALPPSCWWTTFPSGGGGKARGGKLKAMGLKPGVADILILASHVTDNSIEVIWLELKVPEGRTSPAQQAFTTAMFSLPRVYPYVVRTMEGIEAVLIGHGIQLRARITAGGAWAKEAA